MISNIPQFFLFPIPLIYRVIFLVCATIIEILKTIDLTNIFEHTRYDLDRPPVGRHWNILFLSTPPLALDWKLKIWSTWVKF